MIQRHLRWAILGSFDEIAGRLTNMFDSTHKRNERIFLDPLTGEVTSIKRDANDAE